LFQGLVGIVTGGASGLGKATVERFVKQGAKVVLCDIDTTLGEQVAKGLGEQNCLFVPTDVKSENDVSNALKITEKKFGHLDVLVNCAGVVHASEVYKFNQNKPINLEAFENSIMTNIAGTFNVIRLSVELMAKNKPTSDGQRGVIINASSATGYDGNFGQCVYSGCAGGLNSMTLPLSRDLAKQGIRVVSIAAGLFDTQLMDFPDFVRKYMYSKTVSPKRYGHPQEFVDCVVSIIDNPMLNGEVIRLDGAFRRI
ncbi:hypothetical protein LOTGIDRAFT_130767, partial [Lottia gigantea]